MSRSIRINDKVYMKLRDRQLPRESISEIIERLLVLVELLEQVALIIQDQPTYLKRLWERKGRKEKERNE